MFAVQSLMDVKLKILHILSIKNADQVTTFYFGCLYLTQSVLLDILPTKGEDFQEGETTKFAFIESETTKFGMQTIWNKSQVMISPN